MSSIKLILAGILGWLAAWLSRKPMATSIALPSATTDVGAVAGAVTEVLRAEEQVRAEENTPGMVAAKEAQLEQTAADKTNAAIAARDTQEMRNEISA